MIELAIQVFEVSVQVIFPTPRTFMKDRVDSDAQWLTDNASGFAIPPADKIVSVFEEAAAVYGLKLRPLV